MNESAIHVSSVKREHIDIDEPHDFLVKFNPPLKLDPQFKHFLALDRLSMTYSWYNIRSSYGNNKIKYTHDGTTWQTITFTDGMYSYSDINDYIHQYMDQKSHHTTDSKGEKVYSINISFILSTYRVLMTLSGDYKVDLRGTDFGDLIGFEKKLVTKTQYGTRLPNITKSIDSLNLNVSAIKDSVANGVNTNTIAVIPTDNLTRSYPFTFEPRRPLYCPVSSNLISEMRIYVTDSIGQAINLNGIDWLWHCFLDIVIPHLQSNTIIKNDATIRV